MGEGVTGGFEDLPLAKDVGDSDFVMSLPTEFAQYTYLGGGRRILMAVTSSLTLDLKPQVFPAEKVRCR